MGDFFFEVDMCRLEKILDLNEQRGEIFNYFCKIDVSLISILMKRVLISMFMACVALFANAEEFKISGPDGRLQVTISQNEVGGAEYSVTYDSKVILEASPLGLITNESDFSKGLTIIDVKEQPISKSYTANRIKRSQVEYNANQVVITYETAKKERMTLTMQVSNNDIALKYGLALLPWAKRCIVEQELTGFNFPEFTTTFITPQATPMIGWERTKPSYEEEYVADDKLSAPSKYGVGYTFPALFHVGENGWVLLTESGVGSLYCGAKLSEGNVEGIYTIAYPEPGENNGLGSANPGLALPGETPWRTITVGNTLKPIVETTIPYDVVDPLYEPSKDYQFGRATWSWLEWQDGSINYNDQKTFIDLAADLNFQFVLVDNWWDRGIGKEKIAELVEYAKGKNVGLCLWYNSNGYWSDAPQSPKNKMNTSIARKKEMAWMQSVGIKGIKVDFFGGDKQETMQLYEEILSDANDYGLTVIFHGCTIPRGWEIMYPNYVGSEAVLASENLIFYQHFNDMEAYNACLHPFIRNSVGIMDFGPVLLNKFHSKSNERGYERKTSETFQLATAVLFHNPVQNFGITPNNLTEFPEYVIDFMREVPTTWDETIFIDGYPGKYVVLARKHGNTWYVAAINAEKQAKKIKVQLPMFAGQEVDMYYDNKKDRTPQLKRVAVNKSGMVTLEIPTDGAVIFKR